MKVLVEMGRGVRDVAAWALHRLADRVGSQAIHSLGDRVSGLTLRKLLLWVPLVGFLVWASQFYVEHPHAILTLPEGPPEVSPG